MSALCQNWKSCVLFNRQFVKDHNCMRYDVRSAKKYPINRLLLVTVYKYSQSANVSLAHKLRPTRFAYKIRIVL